MDEGCGRAERHSNPLLDQPIEVTEGTLMPFAFRTFSLKAAEYTNISNRLLSFPSEFGSRRSVWTTN